MAHSTLPAPASGHPDEARLADLVSRACRASQLATTLTSPSLRTEAARAYVQLDREARELALAMQLDSALADQAERLALWADVEGVLARALGPDDGDDDPPPVESPDGREEGRS